MSAYEMQIRATAEYYDRQMQEIERGGGEVLSSVVPGSRLHDLITNPVTEGIDEG
jgi:hypothetical protein